MTDRRHILTVNAEEYFHTQALAGAVRPKHWDRLESRFEAHIDACLALLAEHRATATFFVYGWSAARHPDVLHRILESGHEIGSRGFVPRRIQSMTEDGFRADLARTKAIFASIGIHEVHGYRSATWLWPSELWALDVLAAEGYAFDSSINPLFRRFRDHGEFDQVEMLQFETGSLTEVPVSTTQLLGWRLPIGGGNYVRQLPQKWMQRSMQRWVDSHTTPFVFYFNSWELDATQPEVYSPSRLNRVRQYRNREQMRTRLTDYLHNLTFESIGQSLGCAPQEIGAPSTPAGPAASTAPSDAALRTRVSIVIPVYNESATLPFLQATLDELIAAEGHRYAIQLVFVNDASIDDTWDRLRETYGHRADVKLIHLVQNRGVGAALLTGIQNADHDIVCTMDADCSYEPALLMRMIPALTDGDLITASPYHPKGKVQNVPWWRLFLSRGLSRLYSLAIGERFYTLTSCCRVQRREDFAGMTLEHGNFLGVAEMILRLHAAKARIIEFPATLEVRLLGTSKMRTLGVISGHLLLFWQLITRTGPFHEQTTSQSLARRRQQVVLHEDPRGSGLGRVSELPPQAGGSRPRETGRA